MPKRKQIPALPVRIVRHWLSAGAKDTPHEHPFFEFCFVQSGRGILSVDGRSQLVPVHTLTVIRPHAKHHLTSDGGWAIGVQLLQFDPAWVADEDHAALTPVLERLAKTSGSPVSLRSAIGQKLAAQLLRLQRDIAQRDARRCREAIGAICQEISQVGTTPPSALSAHSGRTTRAVPQEVSTSGRPELERVLAYIEANLARPISRQELARQAAFAPSYFSALFREATGVTIPEYINLRRVNRAKELLRQPDTRVSAVCYAVGFRDLSNFNRVFKRVTGCTPREFREQVLGRAED